jgi:hypothetical protein
MITEMIYPGLEKISWNYTKHIWLFQENIFVKNAAKRFSG